MGKRFVMGDPHGNIDAFNEVIEKSGFDKEKDRIVCLGDITDRGLGVYDIVEFFLSCKDYVFVRGNHDQWFIEWLIKGIHPTGWLQGGFETAHSYAIQYNLKNDVRDKKVVHNGDNSYATNLLVSDIPETHKNFFLQSKLYHIEDNMLFVHAGIDRYEQITYTEIVDPGLLFWDREFWKQALSCSEGVKLKTIDDFSEIFIGHTPTIHFKKQTPMYSGGVWNLDTGAGYSKLGGRLTIMDIDTKEYWQSNEKIF